MEKKSTRLSANPKYWPWIVRLAALIHRAGISLTVLSRQVLGTIYADDRTARHRDFVAGFGDLQDRIGAILKAYRADPEAYKYFFGHPYQGLGIVGVFGDRLSDYRFDEYELRKFIRQEDRVLDIGCNCGFMAILASYRTGCRSHGIDINPHMIRIGEACASHLRIDDLVTLTAGRLQAFRPDAPFDVVLSFATHWTDDNNYRVSIEDHMQRMAEYCRPGGLLIFETHCNDVGRPEFYAAMEKSRAVFEFDGVYKQTDSGTRELYLMRRR